MQVLLSAEIRDKTVFNATWSITNKSVGHLPIWLLTDSFYTLILSDKGVRILGKRSGGGSCSVQSNSTADGWIYAISNNIHLINAAGEDIDRRRAGQRGACDRGRGRNPGLFRVL